MAYAAYLTKLQNVRKAENSDRLWAADVFGEGVIIGPDMYEGQVVLYLPADGRLERWFGDQFNLFRKNEDGTPQGGYVENNGHIKAIKLRGNHSSGIVIPYDKIVLALGSVDWKVGDEVTEVHGKVFVRKYIPRQKHVHPAGKTSYKGRKLKEIRYEDFAMHEDTKQLAYYIDELVPGDRISISAKMHGTSQRSMRTEATYPLSWWRKLLHLKPKTKEVYICGTRRCVLGNFEGGFYGNDAFRKAHHDKIAKEVWRNCEVFYEVVGYYGPGESDTIMPSADNSKINDPAFIKEFGDRTVFHYGCKPGESQMYVYRINSMGREFSPGEIKVWCDRAGVPHVPYLDEFDFTTKEDLLDRIDRIFEDLHDPIGKDHILEGVVIRVLEPRKWRAYKTKTFEFKVLEGLVKDSNDQPDMEEAQEENIE